MRLLLLSILLSVFFPFGQSDLAEAQRLYEGGQYQGSIKSYLLSLRQYPDQRREIRFNLAQAYLRLDSLDQALSLFQQVSDPRDPDLSSLAANNAAVIQVRKGNYPAALEAFRRALVINDANETARYNFELLSKRMQPPPQDSLPPEADQPTEPPLPQLDEETYREIISQLRSYHNLGKEDQGRPVGNDTITVQEALRLLEAMREQDVQFIQQLRRTPITSPRPGRQREW